MWLGTNNRTPETMTRKVQMVASCLILLLPHANLPYVNSPWGNLVIHNNSNISPLKVSKRSQNVPYFEMLAASGFCCCSCIQMSFCQSMQCYYGYSQTPHALQLLTSHPSEVSARSALSYSLARNAFLIPWSMKSQGKISCMDLSL